MEIPAYPASRSLDLGDKPLLDGIFAGLQPRISELTFAGLYLFRRAHDYRVTQVGNSLVILGKGYAGEGYFLPPLSGDVGGALSILFGEGLTLYGADETFVRGYLHGLDLDIAEDRDNFDYLYLREELATLPGNRFHKKRNRISYFTARHAYTVEPYAEGHLEGSLALLHEWEKVHFRLSSASIGHEVEACRDALETAGLLGLKGLVALVGGEVKAFVLGEQLNADTSVCHFEKADPFLDGLYQLIHREFSRLLFTACAYVNMEQDLGEPGLRESKLSYHPVELLKKHRVTPR